MAATALSIAAESQSAPRGLLRVNAPMTFGSTNLVRALPDYLEVSVDLTIIDRWSIWSTRASMQ